jgi:hypothetical protein
MQLRIAWVVVAGVGQGTHRTPTGLVCEVSHVLQQHRVNHACSFEITMFVLGCAWKQVSLFATCVFATMNTNVDALHKPTSEVCGA